MAPKISKIQQNGQVTIPVEIRRKWGLEPGDSVVFVEAEVGVLILPRKGQAAREALDQIGKALKKKGITLSEMIEDGREIHSKLTEEEYGFTPDKQQ